MCISFFLSLFFSFFFFLLLFLSRMIYSTFFSSLFCIHLSILSHPVLSCPILSVYFLSDSLSKQINIFPRDPKKRYSAATEPVQSDGEVFDDAEDTNSAAVEGGMELAKASRVNVSNVFSAGHEATRTCNVQTSHDPSPKPQVNVSKFRQDTASSSNNNGSNNSSIDDANSKRVLVPQRVQDYQERISGTYNHIIPYHNYIIPYHTIP